MSFPTQHSGKYFFHFTHLENLESILEHGLLSTNKKNQSGIEHLNVAADTIQTRRSTMPITCLPGGTVHDYIPFYFCSTNPMILSMVMSKNIDQQFIIFFAVPIEKVADTNTVFTDASANTSIPPNFYSDPKDLDKLDWGAIQSLKWKSSDSDERHRKMAEVLIKDVVPISFIEHIIVWNNSIKEAVKKMLDAKGLTQPTIGFSPFKSNYKFHYTKFSIGRSNDSLVTGPYFLKWGYEEAVSNIIANRKSQDTAKTFLFDDLVDALKKVEDNFSIIPELAGIYQLETLNEVHSESVSDHTLRVVAELEDLEFYKSCSSEDRDILKLSAYLHDIGKGPKSMWKKGKQEAYPDHPADAPAMLERILVEDFKELTEEAIKKICLLVTYHDLIGEIIGKGRDIDQLFAIIEDERTLYMLDALNFADVSAIKYDWQLQYMLRVSDVKRKVLEHIKKL